MPSSTNFQIALPKGCKPSCNGEIKATLLLKVGDRQLVETVRLDSARTVEKAAQAWGERFGIDAGEVADKLRTICASLVADRAAQAARIDAKAAQAERVSDLANTFIAGLGLKWHRDGRSVFSETAGREIQTADIWKHLDDTWVDRVADTREGLEDEGMTYRSRLGLIREAVTMATARAIGALPELSGVEQDETVSREELLGQLVGWLLRERTFRTDTGTPIATTYFSWAHGVAPGEGWQQAHTSPVYAKADNGGRLHVAVKGEILAADLKRGSIRRLAADLRTAGFADTAKVIKVTGKCWRVWLIQPEVLDAVAKDGEADNV